MAAGEHTKAWAGVEAYAGGAGQGSQTRLAKFFPVQAKCLACRQPKVGGGSAGSSAAAAAAAPPPPLCPDCLRGVGTGERSALLQRAYTSEMEEYRAAELRLARAQAACAGCRSGGRMGAHLCASTACPVLYEAADDRALVAHAKNLARFGQGSAGGELF